MGRLAKLTWLGARLGAAGGAVYCLNEQGVFGSNPDTGRIYSQVKEAVPQECVQFSDQYIKPYMPSKEFFQWDLTYHWNSGVMFTFSTLSELPSRSRQWAGASKEWLVQTYNSFAQPPDAASPTEEDAAAPPPAPAEDKSQPCDCEKKQE